MTRDVFWNVNHPTRPDVAHAQIEALLEPQPDTIVLTEVAGKVSTLYVSELKQAGYVWCEQIVSPLHGLFVTSRFPVQRAGVSPSLICVYGFSASMPRSSRSAVSWTATGSGATPTWRQSTNAQPFHPAESISGRGHAYGSSARLAR